MTCFILNGCGYHLHRSFSIPSAMKTLIVHTTDPYSPLAMEVYTQLRQYNIDIIDQNSTQTNIPSFHLGKEILNRKTTTTFYNGKTAEYSIIMSVKAHLVIPDHGFYPIVSQVSSSCFENPQTPLARDSAERIIIDDIRKKVVNDLIHQISMIYLATINSTTKLNHQITLDNPDLSLNRRSGPYRHSD
ncbi:LPS assembly lipoprotein LptE [Candidatus Erwinia haradaeae]|nr:LPS assembly lipoprotein LptE [Candidatus Erwinia haradaeae]